MINDVAELVIEASRISGRSDLSGYAPLLLGLLEGNLNSTLRVGNMVATATLATDANGSVALPSDYLEALSVTYGTDNVHLDRITKPMNDAGVTGWRVQGTTFYSSKTGTDHELVYYQSIPSLWTNSTNWLLTRKPEVYLRGLVFEAHKDANNAEAAMSAKALFDMALSALEGDDNAARRNDVVALPRTAI